VDSIYLSHNLDHLWPVVEKIINLQSPHDEENFWVSLGIVGFSANTPFHEFIWLRWMWVIWNAFHMKLVKRNQITLWDVNISFAWLFIFSWLLMLKNTLVLVRITISYRGKDLLLLRHLYPLFLLKNYLKELEWTNGIWVRALPVPMHLGLKTGPLYPMVYYKVIGTLFLYLSFRWTLYLGS